MIFRRWSLHWVAALSLLFLAACATNDNSATIRHLEELARDHPNAELDSRVRGPQPFRPRPGAHRSVLAMEQAKVPVVQGSINGVAMPFLLDTGTTHVVVSGDAARDCGLYLPPGRSVALVTPGYEARFRLGAPESLVLGGATLAGGIAVVGEHESGVARRLGVRGRRHATVGASVLSNFRIVLDFGQREVVLEPHGGEPFAGVLWAEVTVNGRKCLMLVDSGASGVFLEPSFARALGLIDDREVERHQRKAESAKGARFTPVRVERLAVGEHEFKDISAHVVNVVDGEASLERIPRGGLLGLAGLGPHRWMIDYAKRQLTLEKAR